ncbi:response regulator transcription factor [Stomatobaculum longum]|uniref:response regulator transcription factor n=1 Tax=Stomatobaculum longum TaxID=796942 RepID=UPI002805CA74|nr:response regulator transcription factor [Stomatobaculum longum]
MTKILVVDDEKLIVKGISFSLQADGMEVDAAYDGESALQKIREKSYDLVILDLMLPGMDGMEVCQAVREFSDVPIIMLTAKLEDMNKILAFDKGVDDYLTKPFNILEVKARIKAILRRNQKNQREAENSSQLTAGELSVDIESRRVMLGKQEINLTAREFDILVLLMKNPDKVFSREKLLAAIWENRNTETGDVRTVDVHVRRLREKIEPSPSAPRYVHTKWGVGYYFRATE